MRQDDKIKKLEFGEDFLLESAEKRFERGDYFGALTMLNKRGEMYDPCADASALYADIYEALGLWQMCADAWFRFLDTCNEADFSEGYEGLSVAFMNMGDVFQSEVYYHRAFQDGMQIEFAEHSAPNLRLVHSDDGSVEALELLHRGLDCIRSGDLDEARETLSEIPPESSEYPSASGLIAMCMLLKGDVDGAAGECEKLLSYHPENVHALTTYCAVLGAKGDKETAKEIGKRLAALDVSSTEDLFRVSTALCETGLDAEAYEKLIRLKDKLPYAEDALWFYAVAAHRTGRIEEAISALEQLTTLYPRKAVAAHYLVRMREERDGGEPLELSYFYRMPEEEYKKILDFFAMVVSMKKSEAEELSDAGDCIEKFRLAFDQLDGRDEKLQMVAVQAAVRLRGDAFLRETLLDYNADESVKLFILHELVLRNEENSFGVVICSFYREFYTHQLTIGAKKRAHFLRAFAEVYTKFVLLCDENEEKILTAAEGIYDTLEAAEALDLAEEEAALSAVIYREARFTRGERSIDAIARLFDANVHMVKQILNFII